MKTAITFLVIVLSLSCFPETQKSIFDLANIEASHAYQENINALEAELKHPHDNKNELLLIQLALINNYVNISAFDKATALCQKEGSRIKVGDKVLSKQFLQSKKEEFNISNAS